MSDTSDLAVQRLRETSPFVDAVCREIESLAEPGEAELAIRFAELFFSKAPPEFLQERKVEALAGMALGAFRFLQRSEPDCANVEVFNPDDDNEAWYAPVTVIRTNITERPFIVDTIREFLHSQEIGIEQYIYPVLHVTRDEEGRIESVRASREGERRESLVHCEVPRITDPEQREFLRKEIRRRLEDVVRVTDDFPRMIDALNDTVASLAERMRDLPGREDELKEIQAFLRWLRDGGFVFLGYRGYDLVDLPDDGKAVRVEPDSGLGLLRNEADSKYVEPVRLDDLSEVFRKLVEGGPILIISKTNASSTIHRRARMDYIGVKKLDAEGNVVGERRFIGLFTSEAYSEKAENIPILRQKLRSILTDAGVQQGSHDYKEINTIFNSLPKEELFLTSAEEIGADVSTVLTTYHSDEVRVTLRGDPLHRGISVMVILAKDRFSGEVRKAIEEVLVRRLEGEVLNYHLALGEGDQARLHFYLAARPEILDTLEPGEFEARVHEIIRSWMDRVREGLERVRAPDEARRLARQYGDAFAPEYRAATSPAVAIEDILELEAMQAGSRTVSITLSNPQAEPGAGEEPHTKLKLYLSGTRLVLSDFMPILENAGLRVIAVSPFEVRGAGVPLALIYAFAVQDASGELLDVEATGTLLADTILAVRRGDATNDPLNAIVLTARLAWREVEVLRAYATYAFQIGAVPSRLSLPVALVKYPEIAAILFRIFDTKFVPEGLGTLKERKSEIQAIRREFIEALGGVTVLGDDRALRRLANLIDATVRTNYYRNGGRNPTRTSGGVPFISFKFACKALEVVARQRLLYEVWVRSSRMEGVHLRGATVARGGIRYSDRPDDFRSEVLGLVKTQMVKNAVIVPAGSKGGFITLRHLKDGDEMATEAREQYCTLIRGLLDITDNLKAGEPVPPEGVVAYDKPDPYLVVAADKGTAQYSDLANAVAAEYDFWLGDAFASGGSNGYDHKAVGITAGGAWECVKRHFLEMGKDIQKVPFTVVGIGDMSGDVFGNGMLLSRQIRLVGAFDHRHIFIDPNPDSETSYRERERLFKLGRSSWGDYDESLLSAGGMIIPRGSKHVNLTPEARVALGIEESEEEMDGETLIRAILCAPVELLWNGGIGTYVKASTESHADAGDPANDAVRVDANRVRAGVVGEGGNLGLTQEGRIEYALGGGRLNTDAIDNSGGVDLSDREVNLKILLNEAVLAERIGMDERNALLRELTEPIARLVLADNEAQSLAVSLDEIRAGEGVDDLRDLMSGLEKAGFLNRADEHLPTWEALVERLESGKSLTRPELCVLLAYAKLHLMSHVLRGGLPDDPASESYLLAYFPQRALEEAGEESLRAHRLRREIISSQLTNDLTNLMGAGFVQRVSRDTGKGPHEVARAWLIAARLAGHQEILDELSSKGRLLPLPVVYRWLLGLARVLERTTRWALVNVEEESVTSEVIEQNLMGLAKLRQRFGEIVIGEDRMLYESLVGEIEKLGAAEEFARSLVTLRFLDQLLEILKVVRETDAEPVDAARAFYRVSALLEVPWLRQTIFEVARDDRWEQRLAQALAEDLNRSHQRVAAGVMALRAEAPTVDDAVDQLVEARAHDVDRFQELLEEIRQGGDGISLAGLSVAVREVGRIARHVQEVGEENGRGKAQGSLREGAEYEKSPAS